MLQRYLWMGGLLLMTVVSNGWCSEADTASILARLKALEDKNVELEAKNKQLEAQVHNMGPSTPKTADKVIMSVEQKMSAVQTAPDADGRPLKIGGYIDISYQNNLTRPDNFRNNYRVYDRDSNSFDVHLAELTFDRLPAKEGQAGFRVDLAFGSDATIFQASDASGQPPVRSMDLKQAYLEYIAGIGNGVTVDVGKFVTWSGAEVIEASDNINASRSFLFGYAIPTTHTGLRATYPVFKDKWTVGLGVVNGWDNLQDQNDAKTAIFLSNWQVTKWWNWTVTGTVGDESFGYTQPPKSVTTGKVYDSHNGSPRALADTTLTFTPWEKWTFVVNADYAQEGALPKGYSAKRNRDWYGVAGYAKYQFLDKWYVAGRYEYFNDSDGARTGVPQDLQSATVTLDYKLSEPVHIRGEFRHDSSNRSSFSDDRGPDNFNPNRPFQSEAQNTIMFQFLYKF